MSEQPYALKLADDLVEQHDFDFYKVCEEAATELRRLHAEVERLRAELVEAHATRERCNERAFALEAENERLRRLLRESREAVWCHHDDNLLERIEAAIRARQEPPR